MASQTRPFLMSGAALASAAAVIAATPVIAPGIAASPLSVSTSGVSLATFADIFTIPSDEWVASYFQGYGGIVGPNNPLPLEPWASSCDTQTGPGCYVAGVSGVAYLALDALVNGNGEGWANNADWGVSAVNYFFEGGTPGAGIEYLLQESVGQANPLIGVLITLFFTGDQIVTVVYDNALQLLGDAALNVPVVGEYLYGVINSYLGYASLDPNFQGYTQGLSGILNYAIDVFTGNAPSPSAAAAPAAAAPAAAAAALAVRAVEAAAPAAAPAAEATAATETAPSVTDAVKDATAVDAGKADASKSEATTEATTEAPATEATEAPATEAPATEAPATTEATPAQAPTAATATEDAAESATASDAAKPAEAPAKARKRPVRDAVEKVTKSIGSALSGGKTGEKAAGKADAATS